MTFNANIKSMIRSNSAPRRREVDKSAQYLLPPQMIEQSTVKLEIPKVNEKLIAIIKVIHTLDSNNIC